MKAQSSSPSCHTMGSVAVCGQSATAKAYSGLALALSYDRNGSERGQGGSPRALPPYLSNRHFFTHLPALSSHFISLAFIQSAFVFGASFICANTGVARATAKANATADRNTFMGFAPS